MVLSMLESPLHENGSVVVLTDGGQPCAVTYIVSSGGNLIMLGAVTTGSIFGEFVE
jgi:hypothetical protein